MNGTCCLKRAHTHTWVFPTRLSPTQRVYRAPPTLRSLIHLSDDWNQLIQQKHAKDRTQQPDTQKLHSTQSFATQCKYQPVPSKRQPFCPPKAEGVRHIRPELSLHREAVRPVPIRPERHYRPPRTSLHSARISIPSRNNSPSFRAPRMSLSLDSASISAPGGNHSHSFRRDSSASLLHLNAAQL